MWTILPDHRGDVFPLRLSEATFQRVDRMPMKMAAVFTVSLLLLCCSAISSTDSSQQCDYYVATGRRATLPMTFALDQSDKLTWMHGIKIILRQTKDKFTSEGKDIVTANGSLTWANVAQSNAGAYKAEVHDRNGKSRWTSKSTRLCVIDPVPKPTVTHECKQTEVNFTCHVQPKQAEGFNFAWLQDNQVLDTEKGQTLTRPGDQVTGLIKCKLSNRVSSETSEEVHQTCYTSIFQGKLFGIEIWIVVATGGGVVLLLIICVIVGCVCSKRKKRLHLEEEEELRLAWTNEKQQHPQHHHRPDQQPHCHHREPQQQPAGHTGPRQHRSRQQRPGAPEQPRPSPRRPAQAPRPPGQNEEEQPPPLPQPRTKGPGARKV
uniref:T-cell surface antigen CD2-like isoform X2 n=1 Tax=Gasterosteus aculeatus aculeatus TaxID=481459 RepID=UPI001A98C402|nr:T-cell surface antigen CD2-like isoform X2 [Gasterosteus aculeatus aculeatus]